MSKLRSWVSFWLVLLAGGTTYALIKGGRCGIAGMAAVIFCILTALAGIPPDITPIPAGEASVGALAMFWTGLKAGLLTFGGAYTAIPYVRTDTVERGLMDDGQFLDGVALAGFIPAPLVIFCTFVGFVAAGWSGALAMTAGVFLPAFAFSMIFYERLERIVADERLHRVLAGVAAAVVGIIAATCVQLGWATLQRVPSAPAAIGIFVLALATVWSWKSRYAPAIVLAVAALIGWAMFR